jgi:hypothetical protein
VFALCRTAIGQIGAQLLDLLEHAFELVLGARELTTETADSTPAGHPQIAQGEIHPISAERAIAAAFSASCPSGSPNPRFPISRSTASAVWASASS